MPAPSSLVSSSCQPLLCQPPLFYLISRTKFLIICKSVSHLKLEYALIDRDMYRDIHQRTKRMIVVADQALLEIMTSFKTSMSADVALVGEESMSQLIGALGLIPGFKARSTMSDFKSLVETQGQQLTPVEFQVMTAPIIAAGKSIRLSQMNHIVSLSHHASQTRTNLNRI